MFDLAKGFQKLDARHKADRPPGPQKATVRPIRSKSHASDHAGEILAIAIVAALVVVAGLVS